MSNFAIGDRVLAINGSEGTITQLLDGGVLLDSGLRVRSSSIAQVLPAEPAPSTAIQIGDRLRRLLAKRTPYPAGWFGKDAAGNPLPDLRPSVSELVGTVTGFAQDGFKVRTIDGRSFRVSHEAIDCGEWVKVPEEN